MVAIYWFRALSLYCGIIIIIICAQAHVVFVDVMSTLMSHEKGSSWHDDLPYCLEGCEFCFFSFLLQTVSTFEDFFFITPC